MVPVTVTAPFAKKAKIPPVAPFQALAFRVTPPFTVTSVYSGTTSTCAAFAPPVVYVLARGAVVLRLPSA